MRHGTKSTYNHHGCRCKACTAANTTYAAEIRAGHRRAADPAPARAHLNALLEDGWTITELSRELGYHFQTVRNIAIGRTQRTSAETVGDILSIPVREAAS